MTNVITAATTIAAAGAIGATAINWTLIISVISVSVAVMATLIKVFGPGKNVQDDELRASEYIKDLETKLNETKNKTESLKDIANRNATEIEKLKIETNHNTKSLDELKRDNRELVQRLDDLLRQILDWINN